MTFLSSPCRACVCVYVCCNQLPCAVPSLCCDDDDFHVHLHNTHKTKLCHDRKLRQKAKDKKNGFDERVVLVQKKSRQKSFKKKLNHFM